MNKKKTVGQQILEHDSLKLELEDDIIEYRKLEEPEITNKLYQMADEASKQDVYKNNDFYCVMTKQIDPVLRIPRTLMWTRKSCPTPVFNQHVFKYHRLSQQLEYLWSIPGEILYHYIVNNAPKLLQDKETRQITQYVMLMNSGELLDWVKKENGETKKDAIIKITEQTAIS